MMNKFKLFLFSRSAFSMLFFDKSIPSTLYPILFNKIECLPFPQHKSKKYDFLVGDKIFKMLLINNSASL